MLRIQDREIKRVLIVDDDPAARESYAYPIEELDLEPVEVPRVQDTSRSFVSMAEDSDAVVCDYHLKRRSYARFDGDHLLAACFKGGIPGVLCTTFTDSADTIRRDYLRYIPALLKTCSPEPSALIEAWRVCLAEMNDSFLPTRRPWRTLVRVEEVDSQRGFFYAVISSWDAEKKIKIGAEGVPAEIRRDLEAGKRFHAKVNTGADSYEDLFFDEWEPE